MPSRRRNSAIAITTLTSGFARLSALLSQVVCGWYLTDRDFGTFAVALGVLGVTSVLRSGGASAVLPSIPANRFAHDAPPQFWWSVYFLVPSGVLLVVAAAWSTELCERFGGADSDSLRSALLLLALRQFLTPLSQLGRAKLAVDHRFGDLAMLDTSSSIARLLLTIGLAVGGTGTLALTLPYAIQPVYDLAWLACIRESRPWAVRFAAPNWRSQLSTMRWPVCIAIGQAMNQQLMLLVISVFVPVNILGNYYFTVQLATQPLVLLPSALQNVLSPLAASQRVALGSAADLMKSVLSGSMLFAPITTLAVASAFPSAEAVIWSGKWAEAAPSVFLISIGVAFATAASLSASVSAGEQDFKTAAITEISRGMLTIAFTSTAAIMISRGWRGPVSARLSDTTVLSLAFTAGLIVSSLSQLRSAAIRARIDRAEFARILSFGPLLALLTAIAAQSLGHSTRNTLGIPEGRTGAAVELFVVTSTYAGLVLLAVRFTAESTLRDTVRLLPQPVATRVSRVLRL